MPTLEDFLWNAFRDDCCTRELRLSEEDVQTLRQLYPSADCQKSANARSGERSWYWVTLQPLC